MGMEDKLNSLAQKRNELISKRIYKPLKEITGLSEEEIKALIETDKEMFLLCFDLGLKMVINGDMETYYIYHDGELKDAFIIKEEFIFDDINQITMSISISQ